MRVDIDRLTYVIIQRSKLRRDKVHAIYHPTSLLLMIVHTVVVSDSNRKTFGVWRQLDKTTEQWPRTALNITTFT